jgi:hypothetical protein
MKKCKSCRKDIDPEATKCPYCQAYQNWIQSPQILSLICPLVFIPIIFMSTGLWNKKLYKDYKDFFSSEIVNKVDGDRRDVYTYRINNTSDIKWQDISFQLIAYDENDKVILVESKSEYAWVIMPKESNMISFEVKKNSLIKKWEFKIVDMRTGRF